VQPVCDDFFDGDEAYASPSSLHINPRVRAYLDAVQAYLLELQERGEPARRVNETHAELTDRLVEKLFRTAEQRYFEDFPRLNFPLAVVAVGGYGRRELSLRSDVDLLFLYRGKLNPYVETMTEAITHRLWDARVTIGMATRTVRDCMRVGRKDLSTLTSYLDARLLLGDSELFADLENAVHDYIETNLESFVQAKIEEQRRRHEQGHESLYLLQPNLRESVGGLRDYHTALWVARAVRWDVRQLEHLQIRGFIDQAEFDELHEALDFIWRLRNQLHGGSLKNDQLHFEVQEQMAECLGFEAGEGLLPVEALMRAYYVHARAVSRISRRAVDHARSLLAQRRGLRERPSSPVEEGFTVVGEKLEIPQPRALRERPVRLLAVFAVAQHHDVELSPRAERLVQQNLDRIDDDFRRSPEAARLFLQILSSPTRVYRSLQLMLELGVLGAFLPEFGHVVALWQHDLYHTYTVDVHSLFLIEQLRRLRKGRFQDELPLPTELMQEERSPMALFLACLLHDIGKGRGGAHATKGAQLVLSVCERLGLSQGDTEAVQFLIQHHEVMSSMADQRDAYDPRQIERLVNLAGTRDRLRELYLLTVADIRSVSPVAWTKWKAGWLEAFYRNAAEWLEAGEQGDQARRFSLERAMKRAAETQENIAAMLEASGIERSRAVRFLESMPRRYLLSHTPAEIGTHVRAALSFVESCSSVAVRSFTSEHGSGAFWGLLVLAPDTRGLFATVTGVLTASGHDILAAQVYSSRDEIAVEIYQLYPIAGGEVEAKVECERIEERLHQVLSGDRDVSLMVAGRRPEVQTAVRTAPPTVRISNDESDFYTVIDVATNDRPALLYDITRTLTEFDLHVVMSRAATRASYVTDSFSVTREGHKLTDPQRMREVEEALLRAIRRERN